MPTEVKLFFISKPMELLRGLSSNHQIGSEWEVFDPFWAAAPEVQMTYDSTQGDFLRFSFSVFRPPLASNQAHRPQ